MAVVLPTTGLAENFDARSVPTGSLITGTNARMHRQGRYSRRNGVELLTNQTEAGTMQGVTSAFETLAVRGDEPVLIQADGLRAYSRNADKFIRKGPGIVCNVDEVPIVAASSAQNLSSLGVWKSAHNLDCAAGGGFRAYVWVAQNATSPIVSASTNFAVTSGDASFAVVESATGQVVFNQPAFVSNVQSVRVVYLSTHGIFVVVYQDATSSILYGRSFSPSGTITPSDFLAAATIYNTSAVGNFDACECVGEGGYFYIAYQDANFINAMKVTPAGSPIGTSYTFVADTGGGVAAADMQAVSISAVKSEGVFVVEAHDVGGTDQLWGHTFNEPVTGGASVGDAMLETAPSVTAKYVISGSCRLTATPTWALCYTVAEPNNTLVTYGPQTRVMTVSQTPAVLTGGTTRATPWAVLQSRPRIVNSKLQAWLLCTASGINFFDGTLLQPDGVPPIYFETMALCDMRYADAVTPPYPGFGTNAAAIPIASALQGRSDIGVGVQTMTTQDVFFQSSPCSFANDATLGVNFAAHGELSGGNLATVMSLHTIASPSEGWDGTATAFQVGNVLAYGGGLPGLYDGETSGEFGFMHTPRSFVDGAVVAGGALVVTDGGANSYNYTYKFCFARTLSDGSVVRSPMSGRAGPFVLTGGNQTITLIVPMLGMSAWFDPSQTGSSYHAGTSVEIYRAVGLSPTAGTAVPSNVFSLYTKLPVVQTGLSLSYSWSDNGGILVSPGTAEPYDDLLRIQPPAFRHMCLHRNRIFGATNDALYFSSEVVKGELPIFAAEFTVPVPGGGVTGIISLDDKLIIFSRFAIWALTGNGPSLTLLDNDYGTPFQVSTDLGCLQAKSLIKTPFGIAFRSKAGLYLLDRGLTVTFAGEPVQDTLAVGDVVTDAILHGDDRLIYFATSTQRIVFDYSARAWFNDTFHANIAAPYRMAIGRDGTLYSLHPNGVFTQSTTNFFDTEADGVTKRWVSRTLLFGRFSTSGLDGWQRSRSIDCLFVRKGNCVTTISLLTGLQSALDKTETISEAGLAAKAPTNGLVFEQEATTNYPFGSSLQVKVEDSGPVTISDTGEGLWFIGLTFDFELVNGKSRKDQNYKG